MRRVVVGISGASGAIYGIRLLEELRKDGSLELHLVVSASGKRTLAEETGRALREVVLDLGYATADVSVNLYDWCYELPITRAVAAGDDVEPQPEARQNENRPQAQAQPPSQRVQPAERAGPRSAPERGPRNAEDVRERRPQG